MFFLRTSVFSNLYSLILFYMEIIAFNSCILPRWVYSNVKSSITFITEQLIIWYNMNIILVRFWLSPRHYESFPSYRCFPAIVEAELSWNNFLGDSDGCDELKLKRTAVGGYTSSCRQRHSDNQISWGLKEILDFR